jgi:prephenate dehydratase
MNMTDTKPRVSYLGIPGSYSHQACLEYFPGGQYIGVKKFPEVFRMVEEGQADYAMIPVENSTAGRVAEVYGLLPTVKLHITGEHLLPIHHSLVIAKAAFRGRLPREMSDAEAVAWKNSPLTEQEKAQAMASIKAVISHPQALMQCSGFLEKHLPSATTGVDFDTATAAQNIGKLTDAKTAAIASHHAAQIYNLLELAGDIEDDVNNMTRFLIFGRNALDPATIKGPAITTLLFEINHYPGALISALKAFADNNVNLTKLETYMVSQSRPFPAFYVDVGASMAAPNMQAAMAEFKKHTTNHRILGCYPANLQRGTRNSFLPMG